MGNLRRNWAELSFEKKLSIVVVPLLLAAIGTGVPILIGALGEDASAPPPEPAPRPSLEVVDLAVTGGENEDPLQAVDVTVRNAGDLVSIVRGMELHVRASAPLTVCTGGGSGRFRHRSATRCCFRSSRTQTKGWRSSCHSR